MRWQIMLWALAFLCFSLMCSAASHERFEKCLPQGVEMKTVVSLTRAESGSEARQITVRDKLLELHARCKKGKLVDRAGKEIYFYRLKGCWGNPPADYREILAAQDRELANLKKRYSVVEMSCNISAEQIP